MPDAAVCGKGFIRGRPVVLGITDFAFMAGSMGSVVGEKLTRAAERATELRLPLIFVSGSGGGARMQEGILSLMQMAKVSAALARYDSAGGLYISILTNPTMGGVAASFALQGDIQPCRAGRDGRLRRQAHDLEHGAARTPRRLPDQRIPAETRLRRSHRSTAKICARKWPASSTIANSSNREKPTDGRPWAWFHAMPHLLHGVLAIAHTPFTETDDIDAAALHRSVDWAFSVGANGLGMGMVSETLKLTSDERVSLAKMLVEFAAGRGPVFSAVGAESTKQSLAFSRAAEADGCDAVMAVPPLTGRLSETHLVDHFRALADAIAIPVIVQDASGYVGQAIPMGVYVKLLDRYGPEKILFKPEAAPNGPNISALRDATGTRARIFEGSGGVFLIDSFRRGIAGTMPGMELLDGIVAVWKALARRRRDRIPRLLPDLCDRQFATASGARWLSGDREALDGRSAACFLQCGGADRTAGNWTRKAPTKWIASSNA